MKLSFKKHPKETGRAGIGRPYQMVDIKLDGKKFGLIHPPSWTSKDNLWSIGILIIKSDIMEDGNPNCVWRWYFFSRRFKDENEARIFMKENINVVVEKFKLYFIED